VKRLKGSARPVQNEAARATVLGSMAATDMVILFGEDTPLSLIEAIQPDVLCKGADYRPDQVVGAGFVRSRGGSVVLIDLEDGMSTSDIISRMAPALADAA
jgi:D-beta-D-heptose 7-phosphate kinase/D-beta-D-heptose 1-phosphate adenosyltransferase